MLFPASRSVNDYVLAEHLFTEDLRAFTISMWIQMENTTYPRTSLMSYADPAFIDYIRIDIGFMDRFWMFVRGPKKYVKLSLIDVYLTIIRQRTSGYLVNKPFWRLGYRLIISPRRSEMVRKKKSWPRIEDSRTISHPRTLLKK